jgi:hypothetical protein
MLIGAECIGLDEGACELLLLPRRGDLASAQMDDEIADPHRLAGLESDIAGNAVALVQHSHHGDAIGHRGGRLVGERRGLRMMDGRLFRAGLSVAFVG